jgi:hypothetical protein
LLMPKDAIKVIKETFANKTKTKNQNAKTEE